MTVAKKRHSGPGRPKFEPTDEHRRLVEAMAAYGVSADEICKVIGLGSKATLYKYFGDEIEIAHVKANTKVVESLFRKATGDGSQSVTAAIFWCKTRLGWREASEVNIKGELSVVERKIVGKATDTNG